MSEKEKVSEEGLLKAINTYLDSELEKAYKGKTEDEDTEKAKAKAHEGKETKEEEELEEKEKMKKKCVKGDAEGGSDRISSTDKETDKIGKKSFTDDERAEYESLKKAKEEEEGEKLTKSISDLTSLVTDLKAKVEDLSKQPASKPKTVTGLEYVKKADDKEVTKEGEVDTNSMPKGLFKAKVANAMFELGLKKGLLSSADVAEYESEGTLLDPRKREIVKSIINEEIKKGAF